MSVGGNDVSPHGPPFPAATHWYLITGLPAAKPASGRGGLGRAGIA